MDTRQRLRATIDQQRDRLRAAVPDEREEAILALVRLRDRLADDARDTTDAVDLITGSRLADPGGNLALQLCLEARDGAGGPPVSDINDWAEDVLEACAGLARAERVLWHCETGFMRLVDDGSDGFDAWIASKRQPAIWRERADFAWWARLERERAGVDSGLDPDLLAGRLVNAMAHQLGYPPIATVGGVSMQGYVEVLRRLVSLALQDARRGVGAHVRSEGELAAALVGDLEGDAEQVSRALEAYTLDAENAAWHAAVPGIAPAPVVRLDDERLVLSRAGLTSQPLLFLTRELRRRFDAEYHSAAHLREDEFRRDLYALFSDRRFVTSPSRIILRRDDRKARTDVDAAVFDRRTGALALFELKSQDPFARSPAELARQQENFAYAGRQVSAILDWINRHGADEILSRFDRGVAKSFRVRKVYPFVLGRYLALNGDGAPPDRRAAWGTWPQVLRLVGSEPFGKAGNPVAALFTKLAQDDPGATVPDGLGTIEVTLGGARLVVHPTYAAYRDAASGGEVAAG